MGVITISILLCLFANVIRWAELADNTTVRSFRDYVRFNEHSTIKYNLIWFLLTVMVLAFQIFPL